MAVNPSRRSLLQAFLALPLAARLRPPAPVTAAVVATVGEWLPGRPPRDPTRAYRSGIIPAQTCYVIKVVATESRARADSRVYIHRQGPES